MPFAPTIQPLIRDDDALAAVELLPIPAAIVMRGSRGVSIAAANRAFRIAGLGGERGSCGIDSIATRITTFLDSPDTSASFAWTVGVAIDSRYFAATLARSSADLRERCLITRRVLRRA